MVLSITFSIIKSCCNLNIFGSCMKYWNSIWFLERLCICLNLCSCLHLIVLQFCFTLCLTPFQPNRNPKQLGNLYLRHIRRTWQEASGSIEYAPRHQLKKYALLAKAPEPSLRSDNDTVLTPPADDSNC